MIEYFKFRYAIFLIAPFYTLIARTEEIYDVNKFPTVIEGKPRAKFVGSTIKDPELAAYVDRWKRRVGDIVIKSRPLEALRNTMQGKVMISIRILNDGSLAKIELNKSSGNQELDKYMLQVINNAAPFEPFTEEMRKSIDLLGVTKTWNIIYNQKVGNWFLEEVEN